jgi:hypothetical protein
MRDDVALLFWPGHFPRWCGCVSREFTESAVCEPWIEGYEVHFAPIEDEV